MCKDAVEIFAAFVDYCCKADDFGACADDYQEFEATVVLEGYVAVVCFEFHYFLMILDFRNFYIPLQRINLLRGIEGKINYCFLIEE